MRPVVPLEAGASPENPPCPACGEPLFGWIDQRPGLAGPVSRCESCGLGVVGAHTEYHYLPEAAPKGNWAASTFRSGIGTQRAWRQ